jgi:hypothetical protein
MKSDKYVVVLTRADAAILNGIADKYDGDRIGVRAEIILMAGRGFSDNEIATRLNVTAATVARWRKRWSDKLYTHLSFEKRLSYRATPRNELVATKRYLNDTVSRRGNTP